MKRVEKEDNEYRFNGNWRLECQRVTWLRETAAERIETSKCRYSNDTIHKKEIKVSQELGDCMLLCSGVPTNIRAAAGVAIMIKTKFKKTIHSYVFVN